MTYLLFETFQEGMCSNDSDFEVRLGQYPLYFYAARNWGHHDRLQTIHNPLVMPADDLFVFFFFEM